MDSVSIIVPAHNEANVIERCLRAMTGGADEGELEIVVVCNACTDQTAERARRFRPTVTVIETTTASKTNALNLGDEHAHYFPRFYVDADIELTTDAIRRTAEVLRSGTALAAAPRPVYDLSRSNWLVRAFYKVWTSLPYFDAGTIGSGVFAASRAGRQRFDKFPEIIADDAFFRLSFKPEERRSLNDCSFVVYPPRTLWDVVRIKSRVRLGNAQLFREYPGLRENEVAAPARSFHRVLVHPRLWLASLVYFPAMTVAQFRAARNTARTSSMPWTRDERSRS